MGTKDHKMDINYYDTNGKATWQSMPCLPADQTMERSDGPIESG